MCNFVPRKEPTCFLNVSVSPKQRYKLKVVNSYHLLKPKRFRGWFL